MADSAGLPHTYLPTCLPTPSAHSGHNAGSSRGRTGRAADRCFLKSASKRTLWRTLAVLLAAQSAQRLPRPAALPGRLSRIT